jgi:excisionase family DNA binding protein
MDKHHPLEPPDDRAPLAPADPTLAEASRILGISLRLTYRLIEKGELETYVLGRRRVTAASIRLYRAKCLAAGPQLQPVIAKRPPGRPRKDRSEQHPQILAE